MRTTARLSLAISLALALVLGPVPLTAAAATWPMKQRDPSNTGRADYAVPATRMNDTFFDAVLWQTPSPGSPVDGGFTSTSMVFFDGVGPGGQGVVVGGYHWPKGVQGMDRQTGALLWTGNPGGGESIGDNTPAFSLDGSTVYVTNDATESASFPDGHPLMAFATSVGPSVFRHNGADSAPRHLGPFSPRIAFDGRIFLHAWVDRPYAGTDSGTAIALTWAAATATGSGLSDPALHDDAGALVVVSGDRAGALRAHDGATGTELWSRALPAMVDASATIDPASGDVYVGIGAGSVYVVGLDRHGAPRWSAAAMPVFAHVPGVTNPQRAQAAGCLGHDGSTYYFQTNSAQGDGRLYAIDTADGSVKWSFPTGSRGWEMPSSSPIVTANGVIVVGNNDGGAYYALRDDGTAATLLDVLVVAAGGNARASATIAPDGRLYLPLRTRWVAPGGGRAPTFRTANVFTALDLSAAAAIVPPPPGNQTAFALNGAVSLTWEPVDAPASLFAHYAVYRTTAPFTSVDGLAPIATVADMAAEGYLDTTAGNGVSYHYAVISVSTTGEHATAIASIGPRTPRDETDLQVVSIARTPRYPRYLPDYVQRTVTEPSGFGPYVVPVAVGLLGGQTGDTQHHPAVGEPVTYTATVRNRGTNAWTGDLAATWRLDGALALAETRPVSLAPRAVATFAVTLPWDGQSHEVAFAIAPGDTRADNDARSIDTRSVAFLTYVDASMLEKFREDGDFPAPSTDDLFDWLNRHLARFNELFAQAGTAKRVHFDVLEELGDDDVDPATDLTPFAVFPFRYHATDTNPRRASAYYRAAEDIDYGLLHEMGHQLGLIDLYRLNVDPPQNLVSGARYRTAPDLMNEVSPLLSANSALAMEHWMDVAHGYFGQYLYGLPREVRVRIVDAKGQPLAGARVTVYQKATRPGLGEVITTQVKAEGTTDAGGEWALPNVPIDPALVPPTFAGDALRDNAFGYVDILGTNGLLLLRVEQGARVDHVWLDIAEVNTAYRLGQTDVALFERRVTFAPVHDLAVTHIGAPGRVRLTTRLPAVTRLVTVQVQNRSDHPETIPDLDTLRALVTLGVPSVGACPDAAATLRTRAGPRLPLTLGSGRRLSIQFDVTFDCASDPGVGGADFRYVAVVNHATLPGGAPDDHPDDDACPRPALPTPGHRDPNPNGRIVDHGCGAPAGRDGLGADVTTDVEVRP
jgi:outer membrane protein assembly factor BamB